MSVKSKVTVPCGSSPMLHLLTMTLTACQRRLSHSFVYHNSAIHCSIISHRLAAEAAGRGSPTMYSWFPSEARLLLSRTERGGVKTHASTYTRTEAHFL